MSNFFQLDGKPAIETKSTPGRINQGFDTANFIKNLFHTITNVEEIDPALELTEQGLDSIAALEFITNLEQELNIELDPELLLEYPLIDQLVAQIETKISSVSN